MQELVRVITSDHSEWRFRQFCLRNPGLPAQAIYAFNAQDFPFEACIRDGVIAPDTGWSRDALAAALTHIALWQECAAGKMPFHIAADDMLLRADFWPQAQALPCKPEWDIVLWTADFDFPVTLVPAPGLGPATIQFAPAAATQHPDDFRNAKTRFSLLPLISAAGLGCYSISPAGAARLLADCLPAGGNPAPGAAFRFEVSRYFPRHRSFVAMPPLALPQPLPPPVRAAAGKTLVFCTAFARNQADWNDRYGVWLDAIKRSGLPQDQILIVDDGSPCLPGWPDLTVVSADACPSAGETPVPGGVLLYHFEDNLGRNTVLDFPGWHRSFAFAAQYAAAHGFARVIHLESDAFLITRRVREYIGGLTEGWVALFCPAQNFPEIAISVAAGQGVEDFAAWARIPWPHQNDQAVELTIPFSKGERVFTGDRYGEYRPDIPRVADYAAQTQIGREAEYYWWLTPEHAEDAALTN